MNRSRVIQLLLSAVDKARGACERVQQMVAAAIRAFLARVAA